MQGLCGDQRPLWGSGWYVRVSLNGLGQDVFCPAVIALGHLAVLVNVLFAAAPHRVNFLHASLLSEPSGFRLQSCADGFLCWDDSVGQ